MQEMFEESWAYREMVEKGVNKGIDIGLERGRLEEERQLLVSLISKRFPALISFAEQQASTVNDPKTLRNAVEALFDISTEEQARQVLAQITKKL